MHTNGLKWLINDCNQWQKNCWSPFTFLLRHPVGFFILNELNYSALIMINVRNSELLKILWSFGYAHLVKLGWLNEVSKTQNGRLEICEKFGVYFSASVFWLSSE